MKGGKSTLASAMLIAAMMGMPALGQQVQLAERNNTPGERLRPPPPRVRRTSGITPRRERVKGYEPTVADMAAIAARDAKVIRRAERGW